MPSLFHGGYLQILNLLLWLDYTEETVVVKFVVAICHLVLYSDRLVDFVVHKTVVRVKVKVTLEQARKAQRGSRCIALLFLQPRH